MDTEGPANNEVGVSPGERLRLARERAGWTVEQVALRLRLAPHQVTALETGRREDLPPAAYVRGYLRSYAQLLGLDPQEFAKARMSQEGNAPPRRMPSPVVKKREVGVGPFLYGLLLIGILVGMVLWHERPRSHAHVPTSQAAPAELTGVLPPRLTSLAAAGSRRGDTRTFPLAAPDGSTPAPAPPAQPRAPGSLLQQPHPVFKKSPPKIVRPPRPGSRRPSSGRQTVTHAARLGVGPEGVRQAPLHVPRGRPPAVTETVAPSSIAVPNPGGLVSLPQGHTYVGLRIQANDGAVRVTVRDARGVRLMAGRIAPGKAIQMMGRAPFHVTLSQSRGVAVSIGGRAVVLPKAQAGQNVRITVDP